MADLVVRSMTNDGAFRAVVADVTVTVTDTLNRQQMSQDQASVVLGKLVVAAVLFRETMAPSHPVQIVLQSERLAARLIADSNPDGWARGFSQGDQNDVANLLSPDSTLTLMRTLYNGSVQQGTVSLGDSSTVADGFSTYMLKSEQTHAVVGLSVLIEDKKIKHAAGYLVQLLAEAPEKEQNLEILTERLSSDFSDFDHIAQKTDADPRAIIEKIFSGMPHTELESSTVEFGCHCSKARVLASLSSIGKDELTDMINDGKALDINCEHCGKEYSVSVETLRGLVGEN